MSWQRGSYLVSAYRSLLLLKLSDRHIRRRFHHNIHPLDKAGHIYNLQKKMTLFGKDASYSIFTPRR